MEVATIGMILDGVVLLFLAVTIWFAVRLSSSLAAFRTAREDLKGLVQELSRNIDRAETSIAGLKAASRDAGTDLQKRINDARAQADELQILTQSGDSVAARMAKTAPQHTSSQSAPQPMPQSAPRKDPSAMFGGFDIRDREFEDEDEHDDVADGAEMFHSKAERELFAALNKR